MVHTLLNLKFCPAELSSSFPCISGTHYRATSSSILPHDTYHVFRVSWSSWGFCFSPFRVIFLLTLPKGVSPKKSLLLLFRLVFSIVGPKSCSLQGVEHVKTWIWNKVRIRKIPAMNSGAASLPWSAMHVFGMGNIEQADPWTACTCGYHLPLSLSWWVPCHKDLEDMPLWGVSGDCSAPSYHSTAIALMICF